MKYTIIEGISQDDLGTAASSLEDQVQEYLDLGWRPCGGISAMHILTKQTALGAVEYYVVAQALTHDGAGPRPGARQTVRDASL